jgi:hypothetical protein
LVFLGSQTREGILMLQEELQQEALILVLQQELQHLDLHLLHRKQAHQAVQVQIQEASLLTLEMQE